jgi:hypothetical protein
VCAREEQQQRHQHQQWYWCTTCTTFTMHCAFLSLLSQQEVREEKRVQQVRSEDAVYLQGCKGAASTAILVVVHHIHYALCIPVTLLTATSARRGKGARRRSLLAKVKHRLTATGWWAVYLGPKMWPCVAEILKHSLSHSLAGGPSRQVVECKQWQRSVC